MTRKIVLLEANEVPSRVFDHFIEETPKSALARALPRCERFETLAADTCPLSPWITWPTLHRGVNNESHGLLHFGQDLTLADKAFPPIWKILMERGVRTGVFGPMHSSPLPPDAKGYSFYLPDTFAHTADSHPDSLTAFQDFNLVMSRNSPRNVSRSIDIPTVGKFLARAPFMGLRLETIRSIIDQLFQERHDSWKATRRRTFQPVIAFDLFIDQLRRKRPQFSNFFTNHVASAMHRYWAALFPEDFEELELGSEWRERYQGEIDFAMGWLDNFFSRLVEFADANPEYLIIMASSMGQAASSGKRVDNQLYLRAPGRLLARSGLSADQWERRPAMDPTVSLYVPAEVELQLVAFLRSITVKEKPLEFTHKEGGFFDIVLGQTNLDPSQDKVKINGECVRYEDLGLEQVVVEDEAGSTGYHIAQGVLTIYDPLDATLKQNRGQVSTTDIAPAILKDFDVEIPSYMSSPETIPIK